MGDQEDQGHWTIIDSWTCQNVDTKELRERCWAGVLESSDQCRRVASHEIGLCDEHLEALVPKETRSYLGIGKKQQFYALRRDDEI